MSNYSILFGFEKWVLQYLGFLVKTHCSSQLNECWKIERAFCALEHASYVHSLHASHILLFIVIFCALTFSNAVFSWFCVFFLFYFSFILLEWWLRKLELRNPLPPPLMIFKVIDFSLNLTKKPMRSWTSLGLFGLRGKLS